MFRLRRVAPSANVCLFARVSVSQSVQVGGAAARLRELLLTLYSAAATRWSLITAESLSPWDASSSAGCCWSQQRTANSTQISFSLISFSVLFSSVFVVGQHGDAGASTLVEVEGSWLRRVARSRVSFGLVLLWDLDLVSWTPQRRHTQRSELNSRLLLLLMQQNYLVAAHLCSNTSINYPKQ